MTNVPDFDISKNKTEEEKLADLISKSTLKFYTEGPTVPNWSLGLQIRIDRIIENLKGLSENAHLINEDNFDAKIVEKSFQKSRSNQTDISNKGGSYRTRYWPVEGEKVLTSPHKECDELSRQDNELASSGNPRQLFTEIVASDQILENAAKNGVDEEEALSIKPLHKNEIVMVFYHGGGFYLECPGTNRGAALDISKETGYRVFLPDYRYAPVYPFPTSIYDGFLFFQYLLTQGFKAENIIIMGDSAGGNLSLNVMQFLKGMNATQPKAAILLSPWCDLSFTSDSWKRNIGKDFIPVPHFDRVTCDARMYVAPGKPYDDKLREMLRNPLVSPLHADYEGCAPMYIQGGEVELLVDDIDNLAKKVGAKEVFIKGRDHPGIIHSGDRNIYEKYAGMVHIFFLFDEADEKHAAIKGIGNYVRSLK
ncbi:hypothetical protein BB559_000879 [Furculomyces boomerangus]|uniref:Alpha/beta hydrolase fold-3 domain-containing protein n=1 Tax=Furculomyces boomerangus TaxID=61424 RepID=A0A2T9Z3Q4_9FUNG|nr:hypothetical protein BB559_000879 [Furculomyces boomerangus]